MKSLILSTAVAALAFAIVAPLPATALAAESEPLDLEPNHQAMVARHKVKERGTTSRVNRNMADDGDGARSRSRNQDCGSVDIGNNNNDRSARNRVNPRESTVIVTGPVINTARCR